MISGAVGSSICSIYRRVRLRSARLATARASAPAIRCYPPAHRASVSRRYDASPNSRGLAAFRRDGWLEPVQRVQEFGLGQLAVLEGAPQHPPRLVETCIDERRATRPQRWQLIARRLLGQHVHASLWLIAAAPALFCSISFTALRAARAPPPASRGRPERACGSRFSVRAPAKRLAAAPAGARRRSRGSSVRAPILLRPCRAGR